MPEIKRSLKVLVYHAPADRIAARDVYLHLIDDGVDAWLVKDKLLPGQDWMEEIHRAFFEADLVIVCLSPQFHEGIIILLTDVADGDHVGSDCTYVTESGIPIITWANAISAPPLFTIYLGTNFARHRSVISSSGEYVILPALEMQDISRTLLLISEAAGLQLNSSPVIQFMDTRPLSMIFVAPGEFIMGDQAVYVDSFWIDKTEVTNGMYARCVEAGVCNEPRSRRSSTRDEYYGNPRHENYRVIYVSWEDTNAYCAWVGGRLPTEAEWEKAARGTDGRLYPWGDEDPSGENDLLNYNRQDTMEVGSFPAGASPYGALDMAGNVSEWVADWWSPEYYSHPPASNPQGPELGQHRVRRGGSWATTLTELVQTSSRRGSPPTVASVGIGFRCARDAYPPTRSSPGGNLTPMPE